jgi:hypothetical protein
MPVDFADAIVQGVTQGGAFGIVSYLIIKHVLARLDRHTELLVEIKRDVQACVQKR